MAEVVSVVERGWRGARECSLALRDHGVTVTHLIKGSLSAEVRAMIRPYPHIRLVSVPRAVFRPWLWIWIAAQTATRRLRWVLTDNARTRDELIAWCRWWGVTLIGIRETGDGFELFVGGRSAPLTAIFGRRRRQATSRSRFQSTDRAGGRGGSSASRNAGR